MLKYSHVRVCASCEWIFKSKNPQCPKCNFGSYAAAKVYGKKAYDFIYSQEPWKERKLLNHSLQLDREIVASTPKNPLRKLRNYHGIHLSYLNLYHFNCIA